MTKQYIIDSQAQRAEGGCAKEWWVKAGGGIQAIEGIEIATTPSATIDYPEDARIVWSGEDTDIVHEVKDPMEACDCPSLGC